MFVKAEVDLRPDLSFLFLSSEQASPRQGEKQWGLRFFRSPVEFHADSSDHKRVSGVKLEINQVSYKHGMRCLGTLTN